MSSCSFLIGFNTIQMAIYEKMMAITMDSRYTPATMTMVDLDSSASSEW